MPEAKAEAETDTVINPKTVADMTDDELDAELAQRRERRLKVYEQFHAAQETKRLAKDERLKTQLGKQLELLNKELDRCDALFTKMEERTQKIRGIRLEIETDE